MESLNNYENYFDFKNTKILFKYENENHFINLLSETKSLYNLFYILFKTKLKTLKNYLEKNLILNCIRKFFNGASASILFVFKKTIIFDFALIIEI